MLNRTPGQVMMETYLGLWILEKVSHLSCVPLFSCQVEGISGRQNLWGHSLPDLQSPVSPPPTLAHEPLKSLLQLFFLMTQKFSKLQLWSPPSLFVFLLCTRPGLGGHDGKIWACSQGSAGNVGGEFLLGNQISITAPSSGLPCHTNLL